MSSETSTAPVLHMPELEPVPVPGCVICGAAGRHRETVRPLGNWLGVRDSNSIIWQHPHRWTADGKGAAA